MPWQRGVEVPPQGDPEGHLKGQKCDRSQSCKEPSQKEEEACEGCKNQGFVGEELEELQVMRLRTGTLDGVRQVDRAKADSRRETWTHQCS